MRVTSLKAYIVDDQKTMRSIVRTLLRQLNITNVVEAESGQQAQELLLADSAAPDFILCDLHMANGDGIQFINALRLHEQLKTKNLPVILLTGEHNPMLLDVSRQVGAVDVLPKPCSSAELAKAISKAVGFNLTDGSVKLL